MKKLLNNHLFIESSLTKIVRRKSLYHLIPAAKKNLIA